MILPDNVSMYSLECVHTVQNPRLRRLVVRVGNARGSACGNGVKESRNFVSSRDQANVTNTKGVSIEEDSLQSTSKDSGRHLSGMKQ